MSREHATTTASCGLVVGKRWDGSMLAKSHCHNASIYTVDGKKWLCAECNGATGDPRFTAEMMRMKGCSHPVKCSNAAYEVLFDELYA